MHLNTVLTMNTTKLEQTLSSQVENLLRETMIKDGTIAELREELNWIAESMFSRSAIYHRDGQVIDAEIMSDLAKQARRALERTKP